jgi:hypothetical protein
MVGVAQWLERFPVEEEAAGSSPVTHPKFVSFNLLHQRISSLTGFELLVYSAMII